ncbi:hypothetical protein HB662_01340 [Roseomonas frigidaquae]|uniref:Phage regulatory protein CII (CP76) n=1 Tax=Falsiroseomonas frigidaquae TaxID=487318 RepID=A0ABX1ESX4_9PROT|nr:phage regulatory CII family protein [Falsiroseomonas frigidaquae]NKE43403.1 hypothetical protein [Falsiroseomonas frigidaquae]
MSHSAPARADMAFKALARTLIEAVGGLDAAAAATRVGKTQLGYYQSPHHDQFMPADVVARLELLAGDPILTAELARRAGCRLVPVEPITGTQLGALLAHLGSEVGTVFAAYADAWRDGTITLEEKAGIQRNLQSLIRAATNADAHLTRVLTEGGEA